MKATAYLMGHLYLLSLLEKPNATWINMQYFFIPSEDLAKTDAKVSR